jgi:hypothetical protein
MCICGKPWNECETADVREDCVRIDDENAWTCDDEGNKFALDWTMEQGRVILYRVKSGPKSESAAGEGT